MSAKSLQSCLTLCDSIDVSPPGSPIPEILQARTLKWVAISFSNSSHVVCTNYRVLIYCTCHFQGSSLCFRLFCLLVSSVSIFHPDTRRRWWHAVGREGRCKQHWCVLAVSWPNWVCPHSWRVCFPCLHCLGSKLLCQELSETSPGLYAHPRFKPLRFRYSDSPHRCRLAWACILCPFQI